VPEQAVASMSGACEVGRVSVSQRPLGVEYSPRAFGVTLTLDVPTATHTSLRVQPTFDSGTEMLKAGVPCTMETLDGADPQLASTSAPTPSTATTRQSERTRGTTGLMNSSLSGRPVE
jgi:hypothetical protein